MWAAPKEPRTINGGSGLFPGKPFALLIAITASACGGGNYAPVEDATTRSSRVPEGVVVAGDTLYAIAWRYGVDYRDMARWNGLRSPYTVAPGQRLRLAPPASGGTQTAGPRSTATTVRATPTVKPAPKPAPPKTATAQPKSNPESSSTGASQSTKTTDQDKPPKRSQEQRQSDSGWQWPLEGKIVRKFQTGKPGAAGIDIAASDGTRVQSAGSGKVVYQGSGLPGYGRLIIVKHSESLLSAYGYLGETRVKEGEAVRRGQIIADVGTGGGYKSPVLHFEIRLDGNSVDPLKYLPG